MISLTELYKHYPFRKDKNSPYHVTYKEFKSIIYSFSILLIKYLVETGDTYKFPGGAGTLRVRKKKNDTLKERTDYKLSKLYGERIVHTNDHSNGYYARFKWDKSKVYIRNKDLFKFVPARWAKRYLAKEIKNNNTIVRYKSW